MRTKQTAWTAKAARRPVRKNRTRRGLPRLRIRSDELLLALIFAAIGVATLFFGCYTVEQAQLRETEKSLFSANAFALAPRSDSPSTQDVTPALMEFAARHPGVLLYQRRELNRYTLVFSGEATVTPHLTYGRFFTAEDCRSSELKCLVGTMYASNAYVEDGVECYRLFDGRTAQLAGLIGYTAYSELNTVTIVNLSAFGAMSYHYPFVLDGNDPAALAEARTDLEKVLADFNVTCKLVEIPASEFSVSGFFNMELLNLILFIFAGFCVVLSTVPLTLLWAQKRRKTVAIQRLLGFGTGYVVARMFGRLLVLFHAGFALSFVVYSALARWTDLQFSGFFSAEMGIAYLGALVFNLLIALVPMVQTMRVDPGDALRRE